MSLQEEIRDEIARDLNVSVGFIDEFIDDIKKDVYLVHENYIIRYLDAKLDAVIRRLPKNDQI